MGSSGLPVCQPEVGRRYLVAQPDMAKAVEMNRRNVLQMVGTTSAPTPARQLIGEHDVIGGAVRIPVQIDLARVVQHLPGLGGSCRPRRDVGQAPRT